MGSSPKRKGQSADRDGRVKGQAASGNQTGAGRSRTAGQGEAGSAAPDTEVVTRLREVVWVHYRERGRPMPWRETKDPYRILVSEVMLQQTQVPRVLEKYREFLERFPTLEDLAAARLSEVLAVWQGLGYNRRAKFLHRTAATIRDEYAGVLPADPKELERLPGIGPNTAGSIAAFAYDRPVVFIETNIRRAVLHHFFADAEGVTDVELFPYIEAVLDRSNPREWYYALMDWGAEIAKQFPNPNRRSAHYSRQSPFENSDRQVRGRILRLLSRQDLSGPLSIETIAAEIGFESSRVQEVTDRLKAEGLVAETGEGIRIDGE